MKKLARRFLPECWQMLLHGLMLFPAFLLLEFYLEKDLHPWSLALCMLPAFLAYPVSRLTLALSPAKSVLAALAAAAAAAGLSALSCPTSASLPLWPILCAGACVLLFYFFRLSLPELDSVRFFIGILLYLMIAVCIFFYPDLFSSFAPGCNALALTFLILGVFSLGNVNLRSGMRAEDGRTVYPSGMRSGTRIMILMVLIAALLISHLGALRDGFLFLLNGVLYLVARVVDFIVLLTRPLGGVPVTEEAETDPIFTGGGVTTPQWVYGFVRVAGTIALVVLLILAVILLYRLLRRLFRMLAPLFRRFFQVSSNLETLGFEDERESLLRDRKLSDPLRAAVQKAIRRFRRDASLDPRTPLREQVRFVYRRFLRHHQSERFELQALTPQEALQDGRFASGLEPRQRQQFAALYEQARYSDQELSPDVQALVQSLYQKV